MFPAELREDAADRGSDGLGRRASLLGLWAGSESLLFWGRSVERSMVHRFCRGISQNKKTQICQGITTAMPQLLLKIDSKKKTIVAKKTMPHFLSEDENQ